MELRPEYLNTIFVAKTPEAGWPEQFFIITACNPRSSGDRSSDEEAHANLRTTLSRLGCWKCRVDGVSPDWTHREKGFAVAGLDLESARELGRKFDQNAVFAIENGVVWVVSCFNSSRDEMGRWSKKLYAPSDEPRYRIYVIRLDDSVLRVKWFREANPNHKAGKPCYYVGMTGLARKNDSPTTGRDTRIARWSGITGCTSPGKNLRQSHCSAWRMRKLGRPSTRISCVHKATGYGNTRRGSCRGGLRGNRCPAPTSPNRTSKPATIVGRSFTTAKRSIRRISTRTNTSSSLPMAAS